MWNGANFMDNRMKQELLERLGHEQFLTLLAIASIDNMETLTSYAALRHAQSQEIARRLAAFPMSQLDRQYVDALRETYMQSSFAVVTATYDKLLGEMEHVPASSATAAVQSASFRKELDEFAAGVMERLSLRRVKKQWWLK